MVAYQVTWYVMGSLLSEREAGPVLELNKCLCFKGVQLQ